MTVPGTVMLRRFGSVTAFALWCCTGKAVNMRVLVSVVAKHDGAWHRHVAKSWSCHGVRAVVSKGMSNK